MENIHILEELFDKKKIRILKLFLRDKENEFYLREISRLSRVPVASAFRIVRTLVSLGILREIRMKQFKIYMLAQNKTVEYLDAIMKEETRIIDLFVDQVRHLSGISIIVQHGEEKKDKANLLIIGADVSAGEIKRVCAEIRDTYAYSIHTLTLTQEQFEQMSSMGLYPGKKKVLYRAG